MGFAPLQVDFDNPRSALEDIVRRLNDMAKRNPVPTEQSDIPFAGTIRWNDSTSKLEVYRSATSAWVATSALS